MDQDQPKARIDDRRCKDPVDWSDIDGATPLPESSVVYLARPHNAVSQAWRDVGTVEHLDAIRAQADSFELRTLFKIPVNDVARAPVSTVAAAVHRLDQVERRTAIAERRAEATLSAAPMYRGGECGLIEMMAGTNELQIAVERTERAALRFMQVRTDDARQALNYIRHLGAQLSLMQASRAQRNENDFSVSGAEVPQVLTEAYVLMPKRLTAENGAKGALSGEFKEQITVECPECNGDDVCDVCDVCEGDGYVEQDVTVGWDTIKAIYARAVELLATPTATSSEAAPTDRDAEQFGNEEQAKAWCAVFWELCDLVPGWEKSAGTAVEAAISTIRALKSKASSEAAAPDLSGLRTYDPDRNSPSLMVWRSKHEDGDFYKVADVQAALSKSPTSLAGSGEKGELK